MGISKQLRQYRLVPGLPIQRRLPLVLFTVAVVGWATGCRLDHPFRAQPPNNRYRCDALVRDASTHEPFRISSNPSFSPLTADVPQRLFVLNDWNGDGHSDVNDVKADWRRYIFNKLLPSARFAGRTWCVEPGSINCTANAYFYPTERTPFPSALDAERLVTCPPESSDARLEVSAPGLTPAPDYRLNFPDTPIGQSSLVTTITLRNAGTGSLRVNSTDVLGGYHDYVIDPLASGGCQPTEGELGRGVGHELAGGATCSLRVQFRPEYRSVAAECDRDDTMSMHCNRGAPLQIMSETLGGSTLLPITLNFNGRAIGGRLVVEPASLEICFPTVPTSRACTEERAITIRNDGARSTTGNITITSAVVFPSDFFATPSLVGTTLAPGEFRTVRVRYCERGDRNDGGYRVNSSGVNPTVNIAIINPNNRTCP